MSNILHRICAIVVQHTIMEGNNDTTVPYITAYRHEKKDISLPNTANPYIYLVVEGTMRLHSTEGIKEYTKGQYFISAIDSPKAGQALSASSKAPFLALSIEFSVDDVISVMLDIDSDLPEKLFDENISIAICSQEDEKLFYTILRLLTMTETELSFMGKHLKREIIFNLITGRYGKQFMQSIINIQQAGDIYYINSWIKENYKMDFSVEDLAGQSNMSLSSFHQKFKNAVGMGPLQCQKKLRLTEARRLMLDQSANVTDAAVEVGYESVSQFIRDYRRMFGRSPQKDIQEILNCIQMKTKLD
ncbi:MAG: AraC family transcriptional regulator [Clostridiales bacterium]|nr:AraC family transcriptional regulator [Clostridiales bacterium]